MTTDTKFNIILKCDEPGLYHIDVGVMKTIKATIEFLIYEPTDDDDYFDEELYNDLWTNGITRNNIIDNLKWILTHEHSGIASCLTVKVTDVEITDGVTGCAK